MTIKVPAELSQRSAMHFAQATTKYIYDHGWDAKAAEALAYVECSKELLDWVWANHPKQLAEYVASTTLAKAHPLMFDIAQKHAGLFADDLWRAFRPLLDGNTGGRPKAQGFGN